MAIGGGVPSTTGLPTVKAFSSFAPTQAPASTTPFVQSDDSSSYSIINARRVAAAAALLAAGSGLFMPPAVPAAAAASVGVPLYSGNAPPRITRVYYQARSEPQYVAPSVAVTLNGWQQPLAGAPRTTTAQAGFASVPYNTVQPVVIPPTQIGIPLHAGGAQRLRRVYYQTRSEPLYVAPVVAVARPTGWLAPLSVAPKVAKAKPSFGFVPDNTAQTVVAPPTQVGIPLYAGGPPPRLRRVYYQARFEPPSVTPPAAATTIGIPIEMGGALPQPRNVYYQARSEPPLYTPLAVATVIGIPIDMGGQLPQLRSVYYQARSEPPYVTPVVVPAITGTLAAIEAKDTAAFAVFTGSPITGVLAATDPPDLAKFVVPLTSEPGVLTFGRRAVRPNPW